MFCVFLKSRCLEFEWQNKFEGTWILETWSHHPYNGLPQDPSFVGTGYDRWKLDFTYPIPIMLAQCQHFFFFFLAATVEQRDEFVLKQSEER